MPDPTDDEVPEGVMIRLDAFCNSLAAIAQRRGQIGVDTIGLLKALECEAGSALTSFSPLPELGEQPRVNDLLVRAEVLRASLNLKGYKDWKLRRDVLRTPVSELELSSHSRKV